MKKITLISIMIIYSLSSFAQYSKQKGYCAISLGYVPAGNARFYLSANLTAGREIGAMFLEYNQVITLSPDKEAPKLFQARTGFLIDLDRDIQLRPFAGYSLTSTPKNDNARVGQSACAGAYLVQRFPHSGLSIKYELSINNKALIVPAIGMMAKF